MYVLFHIYIRLVLRVGCDLFKAIVKAFDMKDHYFGHFDNQMSLLSTCASLFAAVTSVFISDVTLLKVIFQALVQTLFMVQTLSHEGGVGD